MSNLLKRGLSLLMVLCMVLALVPGMASAADDSADLYLKPNGNWASSGAWFAVNYWGNQSGWVQMIDSNYDGVYEATIPTDITGFAFVRMDPASSEMSWDNKWNQTGDLTIPTDGKNMYTVTDGAWDCNDGTWSVYTYVEPVYIVAGSGALCGSNWDVTDEANRLTDPDGDYIYTKSYAQVAADVMYEFKVAVDKSWSVAYPSDNFTFTLDAESDVTISFNVSTKEISYTTGHNYDAGVQTTAPGCTTEGVKTFTCTICGDTYTEEISATGHSYENGACTVCGEADPDAVEPGYVLVTNAADITAGGQFVIVANNGGAYKALGTTIASKIAAVDVSVSDNMVTGISLPVWTIETATGGVALSVDGSYLAYKSSTNFQTATSAYAWSVTAGSNGGFIFNSAATDTERGIYYQKSSDRFGAYAQSNANASGYISELLVFKYTEGGAAAPCEHSYTSEVTAPTCTEGGYTTYTCSKCGDSYTDDVTEATGHNYVNGVCSGCGDRVADYSGRYYIATIRSSGNYWYMTNDLGTASTKRYQAVDSGLTTLPESVTSPHKDKIFVLEKNTDGTYSIYAEGVEGDDKYLGWSSGNSGKLVAAADALKLTVGATEAGLYNISFLNGKETRWLSLNNNNGNDYFAWYASEQKKDLTLIPAVGEAVDTYTITFEDENGTVLKSEKVAYGTAPTVPDDPTKAADIVYTYTFAGWTPEVETVTGDATYTATYSSTVNTYYVRGTMNEWSTDNAMTWDGSVYTLTLTLTAGDYEYKVGNADWSAGWPSGNVSLNVPADGKVTFTFDPATQTVSTSLPVMVALAGDFNSWNTGSYMTNNGDGIYTMKLELAAGTYSFKIVEGGAWFGNYGVIENTTVTTSDIGWEMVDSGETNATLTATGGYYTFTYTAETNMLVVAWEPYTYTVDFVIDGETVKTESVAHGQAATAPELPEKDGNTVAWDKPFDNITSDTTVTAVYTPKIYILTITYQGTETKFELAYGAALPAIATDPIVTEDGKYTFWYWADKDAEHIARVDELPETMPAKNLNYEAMLLYTGWKYDDGGRQFWEGQLYCVTGWRCINDSNELVTDGSGSWYYFDTETYYAATGITRVPYPAEPINGITYGPNPEDLANGANYGYTDADTSLFVFGEDGKFDQSTGAIRNEDNSVVLHYAINGQLPWHIGFVQVGSHVYYFIGANEKSVGDTYVTRMVNVSGFAYGGIYTFGADGNLCRYNGITEMTDGTLRYYDNGQLMLGAGLVKEEDHYIYVRSNGELVVNAEYYVPANELGVPKGIYYFDAEGFLVIPEPEVGKNGFYFEDGAWFYYVDGAKAYCAGLICTTGINWYETADAEGVENQGWVYVKSNGALATGEYYVTNVNNHANIASGNKCVFGDDCLMQIAKNGIIDGYYYENNQIAYGAGLVEIDGSYYYVRSNGQIVVGRSYWITNVNETGVVQGCYEFDENGVLLNPKTELKNGIVDGYYYVNGSIAYGAGLTKLENGSYVYVRSNGQLATGKYWITNHNGELPEDVYDFGEDGILTIG